MPVPKEFDYGDLYDFPVVIKPYCGEKLGLKARNRYSIANNESEFEEKYKKMSKYDSNPLIQEKVIGTGEGINLLLDKESKLVSAVCHRRVREYPITGGPSTSCVSFYDSEKIKKSYKLLASFGFVGMAMVE